MISWAQVELHNLFLALRIGPIEFSMTRGNKKNCERVDEMSRKLNCFPNSFLPFSPLFLQQPLSHKSYRPLTVASFRLNYLIHQLHPFGYHLVNVLLHSFASILFYRYDSSHQYLSWFDSFSFVSDFVFSFSMKLRASQLSTNQGKSRIVPLQEWQPVKVLQPGTVTRPVRHHFSLRFSSVPTRFTRTA